MVKITQPRANTQCKQNFQGKQEEVYTYIIVWVKKIITACWKLCCLVKMVRLSVFVYYSYDCTAFGIVASEYS